MSDLEALRAQYEEKKSLGLALNIQRGQPSDEDFDLSSGILTCVGVDDMTSPSGVALRNYPGGVAGLKEARELFGAIFGATAEDTIVGNNSSLAMFSNTLKWALVRGLAGSPRPWADGTRKVIVTVPGYDRHFTLLDALGFEMVPVPMTAEGPDLDAVEKLAASDAAIRGVVFVPTYSNPTGETISDANVDRLASMKTAAPDFTIFADDAYAVHHLTETPARPKSLLAACREAGNPNRAYVYGSTSKVTFSGAGVGFVSTSTDNVSLISKYLSSEFIGPNKIEQYRHVKFLSSYPGGIEGLMREHAKILRPKFEAVQRVLARELGDTGLATWTDPKGGYFVSLDTAKPVVERIVELANEAGVSLTPAGASYPFGKDPTGSNLRIAPSRPPLEEVEKAMEVVALCVKLASAEHSE
ncbi:MAG: aminotransferase class I/II-fold pyridoxal phosphate-dependent enzyme [Candidatus Binatia bacterium]|nr:aminotransferase class I/II-fold pyridoxal phosphate-dependent enzyme [Candidatus Binatia bacterium]